MPPALNKAQLEILKLFRNDQSEEELQEIKSLLMTYLSNKIVFEADKTFDERGYTNAIFEQWKEEYFKKTVYRVPGKNNSEIQIPKFRNQRSVILVCTRFT